MSQYPLYRENPPTHYLDCLHACLPVLFIVFVLGFLSQWDWEFFIRSRYTIPIIAGALLGAMALKWAGEAIQSISRVDRSLLALYLAVFRFRWARYGVLEHKFRLLAHGRLLHQKFHEFLIYQGPYKRLAIKLVTISSSLLTQLPPFVRSQFEAARQANFDIDSIEKVCSYYHVPLLDIAARVRKGQQIPDVERERLIWEADPHILDILEGVLPTADPLLIAIRERQQIRLDNGLTLLK